MALNSQSEIVNNDLNQIIQTITKEQWSKLAGKRIIITGSNGFIGSWFSLLLEKINTEILDNPCQIITMDLTDSPADSIGPNTTHYACDVAQEWKDIPSAEFVIFAAGIASPIAYRKKPLETISVTVDGLRRAFEHSLAAGVTESFVYLSTSEIYGSPPADSIPTPETLLGKIQTMGPRACYDESKRLGETLAYLYHKQHKLPVKTVRPFNVFGPGMAPEDGRVLPDFLKDALAGSSPQILSDGTPTRTFCYVSDAIIALFLVLFSDQDGEVFNLGANTGEISMLDLAKVFSKLIGKEEDYDFVKSEEDDYLVDNPHRRQADLTKIMTTLNYVDQISLKEGVSRYFNYYAKEADV